MSGELVLLDVPILAEIANVPSEVALESGDRAGEAQVEALSAGVVE
jgi:hypothetical protein